MVDSEIKSLIDLNNLRSAPKLSIEQSKSLRNELLLSIKNADWFTIGIMAPSTEDALLAMREIEAYFKWKELSIRTRPNESGPVYLKGNQRTEDINVRIEHGLGVGILLSCQQDEEIKETQTFGPFPLDFFSDTKNTCEH